MIQACFFEWWKITWLESQAVFECAAKLRCTCCLYTLGRKRFERIATGKYLLKLIKIAFLKMATKIYEILPVVALSCRAPNEDTWDSVNFPKCNGKQRAKTTLPRTERTYPCANLAWKDECKTQYISLPTSWNDGKQEEDHQGELHCGWDVKKPSYLVRDSAHFLRSDTQANNIP